VSCCAEAAPPGRARFCQRAISTIIPLRPPPTHSQVAIEATEGAHAAGIALEGGGI
jgi:hypothetical protein